MITVIDSTSAARYGMNTAAVTPPNSTKPVRSTNESMLSALAALRPTSLDTVTQVDPNSVSAGGYPMTIVTYAAVNLSKTTTASRPLISKMLQQVTTSGQIQGSAVGELPAGYVPLTESFRSQAAAAAAAVEAFVPEAKPTPTPSPSPPKNLVQPSTSAYSAEDAIGLDEAAAATSTEPVITSDADPTLSADRTPASSAGPLGLAGLVIALVIGLSGLLLAPALFRRRLF